MFTSHSCKQHLARFKPTTNSNKTIFLKNLSPLESLIWKELGEPASGWETMGKDGVCVEVLVFCWRPAASHQPCMVLPVSPRLQSWCAEAQYGQTDGPFWKRATAQ